MKHEINAWLDDIRRSIDEIFEFLPSELNYFDFEKDLKTRKAVERNIEIIGEALSRILKVNPEIGISDSRKIVDTRKWLIIKKSLPILKVEVNTLLE